MGMYDPPLREPVTFFIEERVARLRADAAHEVIKGFKLVRVALLRGRKADGLAFHERGEGTDLAEQTVLGGVHPPERLRGKLHPRDDALEANTPVLEQLQAVRQMLVGH